MMESKSENGLLFALQCRRLMYIIINHKFMNLISEGKSRRILRPFLPS